MRDTHCQLHCRVCSVSCQAGICVFACMCVYTCLKTAFYSLFYFFCLSNKVAFIHKYTHTQTHKPLTCSPSFESLWCVHLCVCVSCGLFVCWYSQGGSSQTERLNIGWNVALCARICTHTSTHTHKQRVYWLRKGNRPVIDRGLFVYLWVADSMLHSVSISC